MEEPRLQAAVAAAIPAQQDASPGKPPTFVLPPGAIKVSRLAELCSQQLHRNVLARSRPSGR
jgi:hypothetical protein